MSDPFSIALASAQLPDALPDVLPPIHMWDYALGHDYVGWITIGYFIAGMLVSRIYTIVTEIINVLPSRIRATKEKAGGALALYRQKTATDQPFDSP